MNTRTCAQMTVHELLIETQPGYRERRLEVEAETRRLLESGRAIEAVGELFTIDVIVNACTHFPLLADAMIAATDGRIRFVDGGTGIARRIAALTAGQAFPDAPVPGRLVFTRLDERERAIASSLEARGFESVEAL